MMSTHLSVFALSAILIASIGLTPSFGQVDEPIVVSTDKSSYIGGETIMVSGEVKEILSQVPVSLRVIAPNGNLVTVAQIEVSADKTFSTELTAGGALMKADGEYTIIVLYGNQSRTAETTFAFGGSSVPSPGGETEPVMVEDTTMSVPGTEFAVGYDISGGNVLSVIPDVEANSLIIEIDATEDGSITVTLPRSLIDAKIGDDDDTFFVLVDGEEVDFEESKTSSERVLTIDFAAGATEIEIIGTMVVPEFGTIAALVLAVAIISIIAVSARSRLSIMPRY